MTNDEIKKKSERILNELKTTEKNKITSLNYSKIEGILAGLSYCGAANIDFSDNVLAKIGVFLLSEFGALLTVSTIGNLINYGANNDRINDIYSKIYLDDNELFEEISKEDSCKQ